MPFETLGRVLLDIALMLVDMVCYPGMLVDIWIGVGTDMVRIEGALLGMLWYFVLVVDMGYHCWIVVDKVWYLWIMVGVVLRHFVVDMVLRQVVLVDRLAHKVVGVVQQGILMDLL